MALSFRSKLRIGEKLRLRITEIPIVFVNRKKGKSKLKLMDIIHFAKAILKMRLMRTPL